jgi:hypothetical protein
VSEQAPLSGARISFKKALFFLVIIFNLFSKRTLYSLNQYCIYIVVGLQSPSKNRLFFPLTNSLFKLDPQHFYLKVINLQTFFLFPWLLFKICLAIWYFVITLCVINIISLLNLYKHL